MPVILTKQKIPVVGCTYYDITRPGDPGPPVEYYWNSELNISWSNPNWQLLYSLYGPPWRSTLMNPVSSSNYRPSKIKIRFVRDMYSDSMQFVIRDTNDDIIGDSGMNVYPSAGETYEEEINLIYTTGDFYRIDFLISPDPSFNCEITLIEACSEDRPDGHYHT